MGSQGSHYRGAPSLREALCEVVPSGGMPHEGLQRLTWNGRSTELEYLFRLHKPRGEQTIEAICRLLSHEFGWELRLDIMASSSARRSAAHKRRCSAPASTGKRHWPRRAGVETWNALRASVTAAGSASSILSSRGRTRTVPDHGCPASRRTAPGGRDRRRRRCIRPTGSTGAAAARVHNGARTEHGPSAVVMG